MNGRNPAEPGASNAPGTAERPLGVIVIGAGQAGLSAAGELVRRGAVIGADLLVLDAEDGPGGAWRHRWDSLTIGRAHRIADLPRFPAGDMDESRPSSDVVAEYYERYETDHALRIARPVRVTAVRSTELRAEPLRLPEPEPEATDPIRRDTLLAVDAETPDGPRTWFARVVVSAAGTWSHPYVPHVPGIESFAGRQLHTVGYREAADFAGQRVLVVGGGLSAVQMILEIAPVTQSVTWATRRPPNFTPAAFDEVWGAEVEAAVNARTSAGIRPASVVRTTGIPMLPNYLDGVKRGLLVSRGMINRIRPDGVRFSPSVTSQDPAGLGPSATRAGGLAVPASWAPYGQDTWVEVDTIFWNTGFRAALDHLAPLYLHERTRVIDWSGDPDDAPDATDGAAEAASVPTRASGRESGIRMDGRTGVVRDPRVLLVGYGSSASTLGATRAGAEAARRVAKRLGLRR